MTKGHAAEQAEKVIVDASRGAGGAAGRRARARPRRSRASRPSSGSGSPPATAAPRRWASSRPRAAASTTCSRAPPPTRASPPTTSKRIADGVPRDRRALGRRGAPEERGALVIGALLSATLAVGSAAPKAADAVRDGSGGAPARTGRLAADRREQPHDPARARGDRVALRRRRRSAPPRGTDEPGRRMGAPRRGRQVARGRRRRARRAGRHAGRVDLPRLDPLRRRGADAQPRRLPGAGRRRAGAARTSPPPSWSARATRSSARSTSSATTTARWRAGSSCATSYADHPYGHPADGIPAALEAARPEEISAHFRRHFVGKNLMFAFAGDVDAGRARGRRSSARSRA